jgi:hypothetical protein
MNKADLHAMSALVERREKLRPLLREPSVLTHEQRGALGALLDERIAEFERLEEALGEQTEILRRIEAGLNRLSREPRPAPRPAQDRRRRTHPLTLGEAHPVVADPYTDDSAQMAHRVGVPEGDL